MGAYLNSMESYELYKRIVGSPYFVDKSEIIKDIISLIGTNTNYICITRPRRFGKTVMAHMISAFFGKVNKRNAIFDKLKIAEAEGYKENLNQHPLIFINLSEMPRNCESYHQYIERFEKRLRKDLKNEYTDIEIEENEAIWDILSDIYIKDNKQKFIFVLDEWDYIFHNKIMKAEDKHEYVLFLRNLLKDKGYVSFVYMTGILPISKYSSGSELNMFVEFTMAKSKTFSVYFGFTETEVDLLYKSYIMNESNPDITREKLREWYNGYHTAIGEKVYNPRSVVSALRYNQLSSYWTSSGPYDEIFYYVKNNISDVRDSLAFMISGYAVPSKIEEYAAVSMELKTKDQIFSAMVVYGFLSYNDSKVSIPNKELMNKFEEMLFTESALGYIYRLARESDRMLLATIHGDTKTMTEILTFAHNTESPLLAYNNEAELSAIIRLVYLSARERYDIQREDKAGIGYVDYIFYPYKKDEDCILLELKVDHSAEEAIQQIKNKKYMLGFAGSLGDKPKYTGRVLAVGIGYKKETKQHECIVEVLNA